MDDTSPSAVHPESSVGQVSSKAVRHRLGSSVKTYRGKSITLEMPSEISRILTELMNQTDHDPEEIFFRSLLLYEAAVDAEEAGKRMAIVESDGQVEQYITGL